MTRPATKKHGIEEAAISLFATGGLAGTTIKDIAMAAGVTDGALYRHYPSKNEMAWQLYLREVGKFTAQFDPVLNTNEGSLTDRLLSAVRFIYEYYRANPDRLVFVMMARQDFPRRKVADAKADVDQVVLRFIRAQVRREKISRTSPVLLAAMVRGLVMEPVLMHRRGLLKTAPIRLAGKVADACAKILKD